MNKTRQGRFYNTHNEIRLVLPSFDVKRVREIIVKRVRMKQT